LAASKVNFITRQLSLKVELSVKVKIRVSDIHKSLVLNPLFLERYLCSDAGIGMAHLIIDRLKFLEFPKLPIRQNNWRIKLSIDTLLEGQPPPKKK
jgi:hypothetical protein